MAGSTLTNNFAANNILWQLSVLAYNVSVMMRKAVVKFKKQEHRTFVEWFITIPAKIIRTGHQIQILQTPFTPKRLGNVRPINLAYLT